jgi:predicted nucleotidyltransferase
MKTIAGGAASAMSSPRFPQHEIALFCRRHRITRLSLFGSVLRDDFREDSDVDVLVEFERGVRVGLLALSAMERELSDIVGRKVDLRTPEDLSRYFRDEVLRVARVQYAA